MKTEKKTTPWKITARYRCSGNTLVRHGVVEIKYRVHETRWFCGERQTRTREEEFFTNFMCFQQHRVLVKAVSDFLPYIEKEAFRIVEERDGLEPVSADGCENVKVRRIPKPKKPKLPKTPLGKAILGPDPFE